MLWVGLWVIGGVVLIIRYGSAYWDWLSVLRWYWWPIVGLGVIITEWVGELLIWGVAVGIWEAVTGRTAFPDRPKPAEE